VQDADRAKFIGIVDIELRPGLQHRQLAHGTRDVLIAHFAVDARGQQQVARMSDLYQRCGTKHALHDILSLAQCR
jgi:hypothetical protein